MTAGGFAIADNRSGELADWDLDVLLQQLGVLETDDEDLFAELLLGELRSSDEDDSGSGGGGAEVPSA